MKGYFRSIFELVDFNYKFNIHLFINPSLIRYSARMSNATYKIVMLRHGESTYNKQNRFCGWFDADLSELGTQEAGNAGLVI